MMWAKTAKHIEKLITDNSPTILTGIGVVGTVATAYLTGKASFKASKLIAADELIARPYSEQNVTVRRAKLVWKEYISAASSGALTVAAIVCANRISTRRMAAMALAYSISEKKFDDFKEKAYSKLTPAKQQAVRDELAQERIDQNPPTQRVIVTGAGEVMCYDKPSDRYFKSNMEKIRKAQNDINQEVIHDDMPVSLADFYRYIGLKPTPTSAEIGFTNECLLEVDFSTCMTEDSQPCIVIDYNSTSIRGSKRPL